MLPPVQLLAVPLRLRLTMYVCFFHRLCLCLWQLGPSAYLLTRRSAATYQYWALSCMSTNEIPQDKQQILLCAFLFFHALHLCFHVSFVIFCCPYPYWWFFNTFNSMHVMFAFEGIYFRLLLEPVRLPDLLFQSLAAAGHEGKSWASVSLFTGYVQKIITHPH